MIFLILKTKKDKNFEGKSVFGVHDGILKVELAIAASILSVEF